MRFLFCFLIPLICIPLLVIFLFCLVTSVAAFAWWDITVFGKSWHAFMVLLDWITIRFYLLISFIAGFFLYFSEHE